MKEKSIITSFLSRVAQKNTKTIFISAVFVVILSFIGISKLEVENSFINYFDKKTEIYKGMKLIDDKLGGTTPLDIIVKFPDKEKRKKQMMILIAGMMKKKTTQNIGLQEIK